MTIDFSGFNLTQKGGGGVQPSSNKWTISSINMFQGTYAPESGQSYKEIDYDLSSVFTNPNAQYECLASLEVNSGNCHLITRNNNSIVWWCGSAYGGGFSREQANIVVTTSKKITLRVWESTEVVNCILLAYREIV